MREEGFEFGAHTATHPHLSRLAVAEISREVDECTATLSKQLDTRPTVFAYPHGDFDERVIAVVRRAGFEAAFAANPGVATPGKTSVFTIPRIQLSAVEPAQITLFIVALKLAKYFPRLMRPLLSRLVGEPFAV